MAPTEQKAKKAAMARPAKKKSELRETIVVLLQALLIALVFRSFIYQPFSIPTASMQSNLLIGDYVLASKFSYGYGRYSLPLGIIPFSGRIFGQPASRGDIAVFRPEPQTENYIKRVIGLPGDRVQMKDGRLYINDEMVEREQVGRGTDTDSYGTTVPVLLYRETLPNGVSYVVQEISDSAGLDNTTEYVVPAGHYFMMGDNRDNSKDSRFFGPVAEENLVGKAFMIWMNWDSAAGGVDWNRIGDRIH